MARGDEEMSKVEVYGKELEFNVFITQQAHQKMIAMSRLMEDNEVGGLLICDVTEDEIRVEDVLVPKQDVTGGSVDMDADKIADIVEPIAKKNPELFSKIRGWWHSHGSMAVGWSLIDTDNIAKMIKDFKTLISINTNKTGDMLVRVDIALNDDMYVGIDEVEATIEDIDKKILDWANKEKEKVTEPVYTNYNYARNVHVLEDGTETGDEWYPKEFYQMSPAYQEMYIDETFGIRMKKKTKTKIAKRLLELEKTFWFNRGCG